MVDHFQGLVQFVALHTPDAVKLRNGEGKLLVLCGRMGLSWVRLALGLGWFAFPY